MRNGKKEGSVITITGAPDVAAVDVTASLPPWADQKVLLGSGFQHKHVYHHLLPLFMAGGSGHKAVKGLIQE